MFFFGTNGTASRAVGLVPTQVQVLSPAFLKKMWAKKPQLLSPAFAKQMWVQNLARFCYPHLILLTQIININCVFIYGMELIKPSKIKWQNTGNGYYRKILMQVDNSPSKSCKVQFVNIKPNTTVKPHHHKGQTESEYVMRGFGSVHSRKKVLQLKPGVLFVVEPDEVHEVKAGSEGLLLFVTKANFSDDTEWCE